ncbi:TrkH family potassium uptake protein [Halorarum salinum]|uniref:TrkH family potassium uptake protein n=1 Tax=Halorarum salinum TaxID=2743089 RepID=A0A7D5LBX6_9EURY|nr:TrkH family potassium uptake protein [Halobaculum salinum]QLG62894.1 TrkH family potassium uptake protein [Halobaculum salinum]
MRLRVDWRVSIALLGRVLRWLALAPAVPVAAALWYGETLVPYLVASAVSLAAGSVLEYVGRWDTENVGAREAYLAVSLVWLCIALVGAVPFVLGGAGELSTPEYALFEAMSGITTTGATVLVDFGAQPRSLLLWRSFLQWLGGLGILALATAVLATLGVGGAQLMETESQLDDVNKLTPRLIDTARIIWGLYVLLTLATIGLLFALRLIGVAPEMTFYDAVAHAFTSISTSGFSPRPDSAGAFSAVVQWTFVLVMVVGATNFVLLYHLFQRDLERIRRSDEFRFYVGVLAGAAALVFVLLVVTPGADGVSERTLRDSVFQVVSIVTTTGYATLDYTVWPASAKHVLFMLMFAGGMAGSTTCSVKVLRWLVIGRAFRRDLFTTVHPDAVRPVRLGGRAVPEEAVRDIYAYTLLVIIGFFLGAVLLVVDSARVGLRLSEFEAMGAAASTFLNIGPAFGLAGPFDSYAPFPRSSKLLMVVMMWIGRLEIIPVLVLLTPAYWRS